MEKQQKAQWILMPLCVLLGTFLLFAFVSVSHNYLSDYLVQNSKELIGQKIDLAKLAEHLGDSRILGYSSAHGGSKTKIVFWSLSCSPCLEKLSKFNLSAHTDLIIPVNVDLEKDIEEAQRILLQLAPQFSFYHDRNRFFLDTLKIDYLPAYVTLDAQGFVRELRAGPNAEI